MVRRRQLLFLHGFASSARSTKARFFSQKLDGLPQIEYHAIDFNPTPNDFEYVTTTGLLNRLRQYVLDHNLDAFSIIGSSYGGLVAMHYADRFGGVERMLLLAPGLRWLSGGLSEEQLEAWQKAGAAPVYHNDFRKEVPVRFDLQVDGLRYMTPIRPAPEMVMPLASGSPFTRFSNTPAFKVSESSPRITSTGMDSLSR